MENFRILDPDPYNDSIGSASLSGTIILHSCRFAVLVVPSCAFVEPFFSCRKILLELLLTMCGSYFLVKYAQMKYGCSMNGSVTFFIRSIFIRNKIVYG